MVKNLICLNGRNFSDCFNSKRWQGGHIADLFDLDNVVSVNIVVFSKSPFLKQFWTLEVIAICLNAELTLLARLEVGP